MKFKVKKKLLKQLAEIEDYRRRRDLIVYPLHEILFMSLLGLIKGYVTFDELHFYFTKNKDNKLFKKLFNKKKIRVPVRSTLHLILSNISHDGLETVFREYFSKYAVGKNIAIDGKWLNGSDANGQYTGKVYHKSVLHIFDKDSKIVLGHKFMGKGKLSEIPAFNEILKDKTFSNTGQIYTMDALHTQTKSLNTINNNGEYFLAKVKGNQKVLKDKVCETINLFHQPISTYTSPLWQSENNKSVTRTVDIFQNLNTNIVMLSGEFKNIQTIIRVTKETTDLKSGEVKETTQYLIANFKDKTPHQFHDMILAHWRVETFHYHKDMLTCEDDHICYVNPFNMTILRSFAINLYQLFLNKNKDKKLDNRKITMAEIKRTSTYDDEFTFDLFEF
jgi:hypothetical protein